MDVRRLGIILTISRLVDMH